MSFLILLISILLPSAPHALYLSTCEIQIADDYTWNGQLRIFHDDLEDAIFNLSGHRPNLSEDDIENHVGSISDYILNHLFIGNTSGKGSIVLSQVIRNQDIVEISLQGQLPELTKQLSVKNDLLMEIFEAQKNVMVIHKSEVVKTLYFKKNHTVDQFEL